MQFSLSLWINTALMVVSAALVYYQPTSTNEILKNGSQHLTEQTYSMR
jgi:hypothetical protein